MKGLILLMLAACLAGFASSAAADIEKKATMTDHGIEFHWWPKLKAPAGWVHDEQTSLEKSINIFVPKGKTFDDAPSVIYGRAAYEPDKKKRGTLQQYIDDDIAEMRKHEGHVKVSEVAATPIVKGKLRTFSFVNEGVSYERVCYGQEGDYWIVFVISSSSASALQHDLPVFDHLLSTYRIGPQGDGKARSH